VPRPVPDVAEIALVIRQAGDVLVAGGHPDTWFPVLSRLTSG
jgi:hypothetical protein